MKREVKDSKHLDKVINGIIQEISLMRGIDDDLIIEILNDYSGMLSDYLKSVIVVNLN